jgi:chromosome condensin MukBEF complex kleisin-like MukF subunit
VATAIPGETLDTYPLSERFRSLPHVVWARHADAVVILDTERGQYHTLNEVAGRMWELVVGGEPLVEVIRLLRDEYDASAETLEADVSALLNRLIEARLIERVAA